MSMSDQAGASAGPPSATTAVPNPTPLALDVVGLTKRYPGTVALQGLDFQLRNGEIRALLGKNGAGKSTFVEMLSGTIQPDGGSIRVAGREVTIRDAVEAHTQGIATVHQESHLFPDLSVRENITIGRCARWGVISAGKQEVEARSALAQMGTHVDLDARVSSLSTRDQQLVAIAKALTFDPRVLILDEPTSALVAEDVDTLLALVRRLAVGGVAVIYVSHRLDEIPRVAHSVTVLRNGEQVGTEDIAEATPSTIVEMMVGRSLARARREDSAAEERVALRVTDLRTAVHPGLDVAVHRGEIVGLWGMPGSGRSELMRAIYGLDPIRSGKVEIDGEALRTFRPDHLISRGVGLSPDDRKRDGLVMVLSVAENLVMACPERVSRSGVIRADAVRDLAGQQIDRLAIKVSGPQAVVSELSGGNQQKVVVGKWLAAGVRILLLDEPTKGIDVEARAALYSLLRELARSGVAILIAPTELDELFIVCDRVLILRDGEVVADQGVDECDPAGVMERAMSKAA